VEKCKPGASRVAEEHLERRQHSPEQEKPHKRGEQWVAPTKQAAACKGHGPFLVLAGYPIPAT